MSTAVLSVAGLTTHFFTKAGVAQAVNDVSFSLGAGEILGLVGESGSGKTVTGFSILGLLDPPGRIVAGSVVLEGQELVGLRQPALRHLRGRRMSMIFQDPLMTLNPVLSIGQQMQMAIAAHEPVSDRAARDRCAAALARVGIPDARRRLDAYPHQFSGGMRQRVAIATAMLHRPAVVIADEPTTALDVSIQAQILTEMRALVAESGTALVWISHDLAVVSSLADRIAVMYAGRIVETGATAEIIAAPRHPYTRGLLDSLPSRAEPGADLAQIAGAPPPLLAPPPGCPFAPRCARADAVCATLPALEGAARAVRCHHPIAVAA